MKRTVSKWLSILSCTALLCTSIPAAFAEGTVEESLVPVTGAQTGFVLSQGKYYTDFANLAQERAAAKALNIQLGEEGFVLLKNDGVLPLDSATTKVSMFGFRAANIMMGGGGSGSGSGSGRPGQYGVPKTSLEDGMKQVGFDVNERLLSFYSTKSAEVKPTDIPDSIAYTYDAYSDAALVVVSRSGSEGRDEVTYGYAQDENADPNAHMLELTDTEKDLIRYVKANFPKVILIVNSSNAMELAEVNAPKTEDNLGVDAILWVGHTGNDGAAAIGNILSGKVSPSGCTADTYAVDFTKDPTFTNFGSNGQNFENGERMNNNVYVGDTMTDYHSVEYREGIYVGYRYYETKGHDAGEAWYDENVVYPFGYGLSYTTFTQEIEGDIAPTGVIHAANETITVKVRVTNTGDVAGKDVVQLYYTAPYTEGGIEKAYVNLAAFGKTKELQPGESEVVTLQFVAQDMASFDWNDANDNEFRGYELEAGDYVLSIRRNAHEEIASITRTVETGLQCVTDYTTGAEIKPLFSGDEGLEAYNSVNETLENNQMSRADGMEVPAAATKEDRTWDQAVIDELDAQKEYFSLNDTEDSPWYVSQVPATWTQNAGTRDENGKTAIQLADLAGVPYTEPSVVDGVAVASDDEGTKKWDEYMNQLTWDEMATIVSYGGFGQPAVEAIGKRQNGAYDAAAHPFWNGGMFGAAQPPENQMGTNWVTPAVWGCTWNAELVHEIGIMTGNEALLFNINGLYGFSLNIHRSAFGGRNFEYLSEDPLLAGKLAAALSSAATEKGLVTYTKHYMDYPEYRYTNLMVRAGNELPLGGPNKLIGKGEGGNSSSTEGTWSAELNTVLVAADTASAEAADAARRAGEDASTYETVPSATQYFAVRKAAQRVLYSNANSNAILNGYENHIVEEMEYKVGDKLGGFFGGKDIITPIFTARYADVGDIKIVNADAIPGMNLGADGVASGTFNEAGDYTVTATATVEGWVYVQLTLTIHVK